VIIAADGSISDVKATARGGASRRRLLGDGSIGGGTAIVTQSAVPLSGTHTIFSYKVQTIISIPAGQLMEGSILTNVGSTSDVPLFSVSVNNQLKCLRGNTHLVWETVGDQYFTLDSRDGQADVYMYGFFVKNRANGEEVMHDDYPKCLGEAGCSEVPAGFSLDVCQGYLLMHYGTQGDTFDFGMRLIKWRDDVVRLYWPEMKVSMCCSGWEG